MWHREVIEAYASSVLDSRAYMSCMFHSMIFKRASTGSGIVSNGGPGWGGAGILGAFENESRWISACREALRLISRRPTRSPRLKFPAPCLNSHKGESGDPVWKTSLTALWSARTQSSHWTVNRTFVEAIHVELPHKRRDIRMLEVLPVWR